MSILGIQSKLFSQIRGIRHGFIGLETPKELAQEQDSRTATGQQVHKADLIWATRVEKRERPADAIATLTPGLAVGVYSADCTPVLTAALDTSINKVYAVLAVHGGWRGTALGIAGKSFREFAEKCPRPTRFLSVIGPCISFESFEVGEDVVSAFPGSEERGLARFLRMEQGRKKYLFDLPNETLRQLRESAAAIGAPLEVETVGLCTLKLPERFPSYRRDGNSKTGRILSFLEFE